MSAYAQRSLVSTAIVVAAVAAFFTITWLRVQAVRHPYALFVTISQEQARAQLKGCAYHEDRTHAAGAIDAIVDGTDRMPAVNRLTLDNDRVAITGWVMFGSPLRPVDGVVALVDGRCAAAAWIRQNRPDVAAALKDWQAGASGFTLILDPPQLPRGSHRVVLYAIDTRRHQRAQLGAPAWVTIR